MNSKFSPDALSSLERIGGSRLVHDVVAIFTQQAPVRLDELRAARAAGLPAEVARVVHRLKSSVGQLGASGLAELCGRAEALAERGALDEAGPVLDEIEGEVSSFLKSLPDLSRRERGDVRRRLIAVVEDNEDTRLIVRKILEPHYDVEECATGHEALDRFVRRVPDAVLLDISLPGIDGIEVLTRMRADERLRRIPVVALTAHAMVGDREGFLARGFNGYASKPILDDTELLDTLRRVMESSS